MKRSSVRRLAVLGAVVATTATVLALRPGSSAEPSPPSAPTAPDSGTSSSEVRQDPGTAEGYGTPERRESAERAPMPQDN
ncbi:hypothetical protein ACH4TX_39200 [Streptomyces sp. NPDC021098]|uniref:hypothetical protein n=1 Tax=unclassified Streptomyces TaxID=2593676 RepID=UPI0037900397